MNDNAALMLVGALLSLILVGTGLRRRSLPRRTMVRFAVGWVAILTAMTVVFQVFSSGS